ncbi:ribokinase [Consotaella salsifontis]|uniref:Ribokinase n=1 Tax=Consotaella salsifontis TaxID=1365950 RepID=A0A1T4SPX5_9HYPH|nr:ribokinase [Consotaella salsifontis]SKA29921.1 ribokinase [Consotaella salsifontis]
MSIVVFGSTNMDIFAYAERLPRPGETVHGESYSITLGGKGANQAVAVAQLGGRVELAGRTGQDTFGALARERLTQKGVGLTYLLEDPASPTGIAAIGVDARAENCITVVGGANMAVGESDVERLAPLIGATRVLLLQLEIPLEASLAAAKRFRAGGALAILDPAPAPSGGFAPEIWSSVDAMTPNETETEALVGIRPTDIPSAAKAAAALIERGLRIAVVKMGGAGVYYRGGGGEGHIPAFKVTPIDTVAAGDCFNGGLAFALGRGDDWPDALRFASACGALATTRRGASDAAPSLAEVEEMMARG